MTWRDVGFKLGELGLKTGVTAAMVGMKVCIHKPIKRPRPKGALYQCECLFGVRAVAAIDKRYWPSTNQQHIVCGQPASLENYDTVG
jgi:hypothetical protein